MADRSQCEAALRALAVQTQRAAAQGRPPHAPDRTVLCRIPDLSTAFRGALRDGCLGDIIECLPGEPAQIVLTVASDDLVALTEGSLPILTAWRSGRLRVDASLRDLMRARTLL
ncbi:alkyl sulfatase [Frankia sp. AiPa1]|uniref:alkyl sulfatase n=1 Tax=Frankia sp. AiPa1 TaxID=573492 RepID=UPI00202B6D72|nr:alkyl sulfatase [Frankia sp. AiPa1]MCL9759619.1 alkyl sulfatase [Frankia sp. AiPa1]